MRECHVSFGSISVKCLAALLLFAGICAGTAQAADTPESYPGVKIVAADEIVKAVANGAIVIDTRVASEYAEAHLKGAISVPYREKSAKAIDFDANQDSFDVSKLPTDKAKSIVLYCNGPECWKSLKGAAAAVKVGHTNVLWYRLGIPEWKSKGLPVE